MQHRITTHDATNVATVMATLVTLACAASVAAHESVANVEVSNPSSFARVSEPAFIPFTDIGIANTDPRLSLLHVHDGSAVVPSEVVDTDNDGKPDALLIMGNYAAKEIHHFSIASHPMPNSPAMPKRTQAEISIKEGGQWNDKHYDGGHFVNVQRIKPPPQYTGQSNYIRYEGPGIESDKVAYRVFLDQRNGFDLFGKKINDVVLQNVGQDEAEDYENDAPWGLDILKVGESLGTGGFGYWTGKQVASVVVTDSLEANIIANGNLYSAFNIQYNHWQVNNAVYDMSAMVSMNAGSRLAHTQVKLVASADSKPAMPRMAIGTVLHPRTKLIQSNKNSKLEWGYAATWGKQSRIAPDEYLGMGVIFHYARRVLQTEDGQSYVSVMNVDDGVLDYYFLAAWDQEPGGIKTEAEFKTYLDHEVQRLSAPLRIMVAKTHDKKVH